MSSPTEQIVVDKEAVIDHQRGANHGLKKDQLGAVAIMFYIIAAASPLTCIIAITPVMFSLGNGIGSAGTFLVATAVLLLFAVGYVAMTRHVKNAGALYSYVTLGLGRPIGLGTAAVTIFAYTTIQAGLYGGFGYYAAELINKSFGTSIPWWAFAFGSSIICLWLGLRGVHSGALVLGISLAAEVVLLLILDGGIIFNSHTSFAHFSLAPFTPHALFSPGLGVGLMFACAAFIGFEGSAIYSEEARVPSKTIPRATYASVIFMGVLYAITMWLITNAIGIDKTVEISNRENGNLIFWVSNLVLNPWVTNLFNVFIVSAMFAALVTFHNNIARYMYILGRQNLVWRALSYTRRRSQTPYVASIVQTISALVIIAVFVVYRLDPYNTLFAWMTGIGSIAIILAQTIAAAAIFLFFRRSKVDTRIWHTVITPLAAIAGLAVFLYYSLVSVDVLLGVKGPVADCLVASIFATFAAGVGYAMHIKRRDPVRYAKLAKALVSER